MKRLFNLILLFGLFLSLTGCGQKAENVKKSSEEKEIKKSADAYAGPGKEYLSLGSFFLEDAKVIREEMGWLEIEIGKTRMYIAKDSWDGVIDDDVPMVIYDTSKADDNSSKVEYAVNLNYTIRKELSMVAAPISDAPQRYLLKEGTEVFLVFLHDSSSFSNGYCQVEADTAIGKMRGYIEEKELIGLEDLLKNSENVK